MPTPDAAPLPQDLLLCVVTAERRPLGGGPAAHTCHRSRRGGTRSSRRTGILPPRRRGRAAASSPRPSAPSPSPPRPLGPAGALQCREGRLQTFRRVVKVQNGYGAKTVWLIEDLTEKNSD